MCHEKYHHDQGLRAVANVLSGVASATDSTTKERSQTVSALLLNTACSVGLLDYIRTSCGHLPSGERDRLLVRVKAILARQQMEALDMLVPTPPDDVPF